MKNTVLLSMALFLFGCSSLFGNKSPAPSNIPPAEVKDIPFKAREVNDEALRHRVLILPFLAESKINNSAVLDDARRAVVRDLAMTGRFVILDNRDFPKDTKSFMTPEGDYDLVEISKVAATMGISAVVEGKIMEIRARKIGDQMGMFKKLRAEVDSSVRVRVYAARNSKEIMNEMRSATVDTTSTRFLESTFSERLLAEDPTLTGQAVRKAFYGQVEPLVRAIEKLAWEGRIALISGERVYINAGRLSGLQVGDILKVTEEGEEVYDPESGRFIGKAPGRMKGTIEIVTYFGKDGAIAIYHSGSGFKENDRVELY